MTILNAYDEHVQDFINKYKNNNRKNYNAERMSQYKQSVRELGYTFEKLFPRKRYDILNELLLKLSQTGITKISVKKMANDSECSERTVISTVKYIKMIDNEILFARLMSTDKNNGHYIFVDKKHKNFKSIMKEVFMLKDDEIAEQIAEQNAYQIAEQENAENVDTTSLNEEKEGSKVFKGFKGFKNHFSNDLYTYSDVNLKNTIDGLLTKNQKPKAMLHELYVIAKGIKNKFKNTMKESLLNSLIVKAMKTLFNARYNNAYAFFSGTLIKMINNSLIPVESHTMPVNDESEATNVIEQQDKLNKAKISNSKNKNLPNWFKKDTTKIVPTMDYEAKQREIMAKLGL